MVSLNEDLDFVACIKIFTASIEDHALSHVHHSCIYGWSMNGLLYILLVYLINALSPQLQRLGFVIAYY